MNINRIGHAVLYVSDLNAAKDFYAGVLQMQITDEVPGFGAFFRFGDYHHDIGVFKAKVDLSPTQPGRPGLAHLALLVDNLDELKAAYRHLKAEGADIVSTADHGITQSVYVRDPEGNEIELYCDNPDRDWRDVDKIMKPPVDLQLD